MIIIILTLTPLCNENPPLLKTQVTPQPTLIIQSTDVQCCTLSDPEAAARPARLKQLKNKKGKKKNRKKVGVGGGFV
jgi:hypothetical protein